MLCIVEVIFDFLFPPTPIVFAGMKHPEITGHPREKQTKIGGRWFKSSPISPSVLRRRASPSFSNSAPSFEPEEDEVELEEDPEPLC